MPDDPFTRLAALTAQLDALVAASSRAASRLDEARAALAALRRAPASPGVAEPRGAEPAPGSGSGC